jgi:putative selenium metabolism hydrolase
MDSHLDTTGVGVLSNWSVDPYLGYEDEEIIMGRGASDQLGSIVSAVYAGRIIKDLGLSGDYTLVVTGTVQEEDCDGLCWRYLIEKHGLRPEFVLLTEPTDGKVVRGQRGRAEIRVTTTGLSAHGSAPERGENAIYKMAPILLELERLNERLGIDAFLGKGTLTVSEIFFNSPSRCSVADGCTISIDRRLTAGEGADLVLNEIRDLPVVRKADARVELYHYETASYKGLQYPVQSYFPTWVIAEDHPCVQTVVDVYKSLFSDVPAVDKWTFSTNGVAIAGIHGIPCVGYGPGREEEAHAPDERTWKEHLVKAAAVYALVPLRYVNKT